MSNDIQKKIHLLISDDVSFRITCNKTFTVTHFLLEGNDHLAQIRNRFYQVNSLKDLLCTSSPSGVISNHLKKTLD